MNKEFQFQQIKEADFPEIEKLAIENGGNSSLNVNALKHQYFNNPSKSFTFWKVVGQNKIEGYATTNNFQFILENKKIFVGMPQNVLVSEFVRGSGLFGKLYNLTEKENREEKSIDTFLTFTNEISTPIFIKKFKYLRGMCPDLTFYISFIHFLKKDLNYVFLKTISEIDFDSFKVPIQLNNSIIKNK